MLKKSEIFFCIIIFFCGFITNYVFYQGPIYAALLGFGIGMVIGIIIVLSLISMSLKMVKRMVPPKNL